MTTRVPFNYVDNPQKYCSLVTELIEKANDEWQAIWKSAILELFEGSEYSINSVNALLKVIEKAFKERKYHVRAQAFDCWQFFIKEVDKKTACEKLLNVILIPLSAGNHSVKIVLDAKLKAWLTLLQTNTLCKSISREKGIPSLLKILYGPHALEIASSYEDLLDLCGKIYSLMVQNCLKTDENNVILSYLPKALPNFRLNDNTRRLGREIWIDATEYVSTKKWPIAQFNHLLKTLENLLSTNRDEDKVFMCELLPILICEYNSYPVDLLMSQLSLVTRCLFYSAVNDKNLSITLEYLMKKFRKKEQFLFDELRKTLMKHSDDYKEQLQRCWTAVVSCFCKWNKGEIESDNHVWILLFPIRYLHEKWNSRILDSMKTCFENIYSVSKVDAFIKNITRELNIVLNNSANLPLSLLSAATYLCKVVLQKSRQSDDVSAIKDNLMTIYEKLPPQTTAVEEPRITLICTYLSCVLYFTQLYPEYDHEFRPIICKYSECIDIDKDSKDYPIVKILSKYTNNKTKEDEKLSNILNIIRVTPNKATSQPSFLARLSPAENKLPNSSPFGIRSVGATKLQNGGTPNSKSKDDDTRFVAIKSTPKNSPMTEHQREIAKEKSYIPAMYEDLSQSQSYSDSQSMLPSEKTLPLVKISSIEIIEENAILPSSDPNGDSADEIPASLDFREAIRKDKLPIAFASKKSLFNDISSDDHSENSAQPPKRKSMRIESKIADTTTTTTTTKRARLSCPNRIQTTTDQTSLTLSGSSLPPPAPRSKSKKSTKKQTVCPRKSAAEDENENTASATMTPENESQSLFVSKTQSIATPLPSSSVAAENKNARKKSLKSKSSNFVPNRSPINTRKRKSIAEATSDNTSKKSSAFEIEDSCSETDERSVKREKSEKSNAEEHHADSNENSSSGSSVVTVVEADENVSCTDSVMIVDEDTDKQIIVIDSENPISGGEEVIVSQTGVSEKETAVDDAKVIEEEETIVVENTQVENTGEEDRSETTEKPNRSASESVKSTSSSLDLALSENIQMNGDCDEPRAENGLPEEQNRDVSQLNEQSQQSSNALPDHVESESAANKKVEEENVGAKNEISDKVANSSAIDNAVSTPDDVNVSASPLSGNTRSLQMLQMVFNGSTNLARSKTRFKSKTRNPSVNASPVNGRVSVNGISARTAVNSRPMKMLQVNGHAENLVKSSPNKIVNFAEKMEKFRYVPKECTSPSILKKPNLNGTTSPKSPKSVNFAERLTDTREYRVHDELTDSWSSGGSQGDNLISDDEATSQETLYPYLHNCTDDIQNIAERLTMNQQQLDTLKRMGIETVGQLASASTIVGKSIPVGDNRIQRLRDALEAYDNDRQIKGLRSPSVRRKITYRSPVEVASIIEVLDDETEAERASVIKVDESGNTDKLNGANEWTPVVTLTKLSSEKMAAYQNGSAPKDASSPVGETQRCFSPVGETQRCSSPAKKTRSQMSPIKSETVLPPAPPITENAATSSLAQIIRTPENSPTKNAEVAPSSPSVLTGISSPDEVNDSPLKSTGHQANALHENSSVSRSTACAIVNGLPSSPIIKTDTSVRSSPDQLNSPISTSTQIIESVEVQKVDIHEEKDVNMVNFIKGEVIAENELKESKKELGVTTGKQVLKNDEFWQWTQDDEPDFICTNHEESICTNVDRRTYSKSVKAKELTKDSKVQVAVKVATSISKSSLPEMKHVETNVSHISASVNETKKDLSEETSLTEQQQSISIFSLEATKPSEDTSDAHNASTSTEVGSTAAALDAAIGEDATLASSSGSRVVLVSQDENLPKVRTDTEKVFCAALQRILEPYLGPACLSRWSNEEASRTELHCIFQSVVESVDWIRSAGLMNNEMRNILRQMKDSLDGE